MPSWFFASLRDYQRLDGCRGIWSRASCWPRSRFQDSWRPGGWQGCRQKPASMHFLPDHLLSLPSGRTALRRLTPRLRQSLPGRNMQGGIKTSNGFLAHQFDLGEPIDRLPTRSWRTRLRAAAINAYLSQEAPGCADPIGRAHCRDSLSSRLT
jgi:hypothetical protein